MKSVPVTIGVVVAIAAPSVDGWAAVGPADLGFELGGDREDRGLLAWAGDELHADRQAFGRRAHGQRRRRLAGEVPDRGEAHDLAGASDGGRDRAALEAAELPRGH